MKKRLESELISIAHRVLKLKNNSDVNQLYKETQKLYETLSVLKFYQDNFESLKNSVSQEQLEEKFDAVGLGVVEDQNFDKKQEKEIVKEETKEVKQSEPKEEKSEESNPERESEKIEEVKEEPKVEEPKEIEPEVEKEEIQETLEEETLESSFEETEETKETEAISETKSQLDTEEIYDGKETDVEQKTTDESQELEEEVILEDNKNQDFEPHFELEEALESDKKEVPKQISFEDFLGKDYIEPIFVKPNELISKVESHFEEIPKDLNDYQVSTVKEEKSLENKQEKVTEKKSVSLNDKFSAGINIGLNDRIAFVKKLFAGSDEDYNRVISQLNTFDSLQEAQVFIEDMVKPDYNNWDGNEEYETRFMELISKKFL